MRVLRISALTRSAVHPLRLNTAKEATPAALVLSNAARLNSTTVGASSSPQNSLGDEILGGTEKEAANTPVPKRKRFTATVNFKISPEKVDSDNCPSASEIKEMLPTAAELYEQLPTTAEVRKMYDLDRPGAGRAPPTPEIYASQGVMASLKRTVLGALSKESDLNNDNAATSGGGEKGGKGFEGFLDRFSLHPEATTVGPHAMSKPTAASSSPAAGAGEDEALWPDCDTPEDILNEERFGGEGDEAPKPTGEHVVLAWKALLYGSVLATVVTAFCGWVMCWYMGFSSFSQIKEHLQTRKEREIERLKEEARRQKKEEKRDGSGGEDELIVDDDDVHVYEIDLTQPSTLMEQVNGLVKLIEDLAAAEAEKENNNDTNNNAASSVRSNSSTNAPRGVEIAPASSNNSFTFIDMRSAGDSVEDAANPLRPTKRNYSL